MRLICYFAIFFLSCGGLPAQPVKPSPSPQLSDSRSRFAETLPFYLKHYPVSGKAELIGETPNWQPMPENLDVHVTRLGVMHGRTLHAVRYLPGGKPIREGEGAGALMILAGKRGTPERFEPVYLIDGKRDKMFVDFTAGPVMEQRGQSFMVLRTHIHDVVSSVFRTCLTINQSNGNFQLTSLDISLDELVVYLKQGWDLTREGSMGDIDERNLSMTIPLARLETSTGKRTDALLIYQWRFIGGELKRSGPAGGVFR